MLQASVCHLCLINYCNHFRLSFCEEEEQKDTKKGRDGEKGEGTDKCVKILQETDMNVKSYVNTAACPGTRGLTCSPRGIVQSC